MGEKRRHLFIGITPIGLYHQVMTPHDTSAAPHPHRFATRQHTDTASEQASRVRRGKGGRDDGVRCLRAIERRKRSAQTCDIVATTSHALCGCGTTAARKACTLRWQRQWQCSRCCAGAANGVAIRRATSGGGGGRAHCLLIVPCGILSIL